MRQISCWLSTDLASKFCQPRLLGEEDAAEKGKVWHGSAAWVCLARPIGQTSGCEKLQTEDGKKKNKLISQIIRKDSRANLQFILIKFNVVKENSSLPVRVTLSSTIKICAGLPFHWHFYLELGCPTGFQHNSTIHRLHYVKPASDTQC